MMLIFIYHFFKINVESMDENFVASEIHQLVPMSCFDLNELPQEGILFYFILSIVYISFIIEYDVDFFF